MPRTKKASTPADVTIDVEAQVVEEDILDASHIPAADPVLLEQELQKRARHRDEYERAAYLSYRAQNQEQEDILKVRKNWVKPKKFLGLF